jgi:hypothetical protein
LAARQGHAGVSTVVPAGSGSGPGGLGAWVLGPAWSQQLAVGGQLVVPLRLRCRDLKGERGGTRAGKPILSPRSPNWACTRPMSMTPNSP